MYDETKCMEWNNGYAAGSAFRCKVVLDQDAGIVCEKVLEIQKLKKQLEIAGFLISDLLRMAPTSNSMIYMREKVIKASRQIEELDQ